MLDEQLNRCGPEAVLRRFFGVQGRATHEKVNPALSWKCERPSLRNGSMCCVPRFATNVLDTFNWSIVLRPIPFDSAANGGSADIGATGHIYKSLSAIACEGFGVTRSGVDGCYQRPAPARLSEILFFHLGEASAAAKPEARRRIRRSKCGLLTYPADSA